ncbi:MAG: hypothetical protein EOP84_17770, partial [Verrucomicrobiaceae bacterium]
MQGLRRLVLTLLTSLFLTGFASAETIRVTTWNLQWFPSGSQNRAAPEQEEAKIRQAAEVITILNPDVLLLQEVRDWEACQKLADALKPMQYHVAVCSTFRDSVGGAVGWQQVAILSKRHAQAAWAARWSTKGVVDLPRGFAFSVFRWGSIDVGFYSVHLKSNLVRGNNERAVQLNILKRELAAEQLVAHTADVQKSFPGTLRAFVAGGDFNTNKDESTFVSERTLDIFNDAGFLNPFSSLKKVKRFTHPGKGRYPD